MCVELELIFTWIELEEDDSDNYADYAFYGVLYYLHVFYFLVDWRAEKSILI